MDLQLIPLNLTGFSMMCSHAIMGLGRYAVDHGVVKAVSPEAVVRIQSPCGLLTANVKCEDGKSGAARVRSSPCFVFATDLIINLGMPNVVLFKTIALNLCTHTAGYGELNSRGVFLF